MKKNPLAALTAVLFTVSTAVAAQVQPGATTISECPAGYIAASIDVVVDVSTAADCPLLEDKKLRKLVNKHGAGSIFAYPAKPGTCVSGTDLSGSIRLDDGHAPIQVEGYSESAQKLLVEADVFNDPDAIPSSTSPLFVTGITDAFAPFVSGAAMTVVALQGTGADTGFKMTIVMEDRFSLNLSTYPFIDIEDFLIVGTRGDLKAIGRLKGKADIFSLPQQPLYQVPLTVSGRVCVK